jgi:hypothetical protein
VVVAVAAMRFALMDPEWLGPALRPIRSYREAAHAHLHFSP